MTFRHAFRKEWARRAATRPERILLGPTESHPNFEIGRFDPADCAIRQNHY